MSETKIGLKHSHCIDDRIVEVVLVVVFVCVCVNNNNNFDGERTQISLLGRKEVRLFERRHMQHIADDEEIPIIMNRIV